MNFRTPFRASIWLFCALLTLSVVAITPVQAQNPAYAVLIVGDEGDAEMLRTEKVLINEMAKQIRNEADGEAMPIYSYHFNKERERAYCENKLNVLAEDLLFVGIVTLVNKVPTKVVYRIDRIVNASRAAKDVLDRADELLEDSKPKTTTVVPVAPNPPAQQPTATATPPASSAKSAAVEEGFRVQLGSFTSKANADDCKADAERAGFSVQVVEAKGPNGNTVYKVLSQVLKDRAAADEQLAKLKSAGFENAFSVRATP